MILSVYEGLGGNADIRPVLILRRLTVYNDPDFVFIGHKKSTLSGALRFNQYGIEC